MNRTLVAKRLARVLQEHATVVCVAKPARWAGGPKATGMGRPRRQTSFLVPWSLLPQGWAVSVSGSFAGQKIGGAAERDTKLRTHFSMVL